MHVLVVEDDPRVGRLVERGFEEAGHTVTLVDDGEAGLAQAADRGYDLIVLDVLLPTLDGLTVCRRLRERHLRTPILLLTARDAVLDRVRGLDAGADDYLIKPFALDELLARARALLRRAGEGDDGTTLQVGDLVLDVARHEARRGDRAIELTAKEFSLLEYLMRNAGRVLTKAQIVDQVWGYTAAPASNVVEIYVHYLRDKIDQGFARPLIRTVRGVGYTLKE